MSELDTQWNQSLAEGVLRFPQCDYCGRWNWYPLSACGDCKKTEFTWQSVALRGTLYSWTKVHRNFSGKDVGDLPYIVGIVDIGDAAGVRIPCRFSSENNKQPKIGEPVKLLRLSNADGQYWGFTQ